MRVLILSGKKEGLILCAKNAYIIVRWEFSPKDKICLRLAGLACGSMYYCPENTFWTKGSRRSVSPGVQQLQGR